MPITNPLKSHIVCTIGKYLSIYIYIYKEIILAFGDSTPTTCSQNRANNATLLYHFPPPIHANRILQHLGW